MGVHAARVRGRKLQERRSLWFAIHPLCVACEAAGRIKAAEQLDHIQALTNGGKDDETNLQGLCKECHKAKTAIDLRHAARVFIGIDGWPVGEG